MMLESQPPFMSFTQRRKARKKQSQRNSTLRLCAFASLRESSLEKLTFPIALVSSYQQVASALRASFKRGSIAAPCGMI